MTVDFSNTYRVYRINVRWNFPLEMKAAIPPGSHLVPAVALARVAVITPTRPEYSISQACVSHLLMLPSEANVNPAIIAVYTGVIPGSNAGTNSGEDRTSHVARWELQAILKGLHPVFSQLKLHKEEAPRVEPEVRHEVV